MRDSLRSASFSNRRENPRYNDFRLLARRSEYLALFDPEF